MRSLRPDVKLGYERIKHVARTERARCYRALGTRWHVRPFKNEHLISQGGTKLMLIRNKHITIGQDCGWPCVNDIAAG